MPLTRRVPKYGFTNPNRVTYKAVNLDRLAALVENGRIDPAAPVTPETLVEAGQIKKGDRVKILGSGEIEAALQVSAHKFSASARQKIEAAGGSVTEIS